jgi:hypothetical protein
VIEGIVYSPKERIPLFRLVYDSMGDIYVEYKHSKNHCTDCIPLEKLIIYLLENETKNDNLGKMIYSPKEGIPIGILQRDYDGSFFIEVKSKKAIERIRFSTYITLLIGTVVQKAS